LQLKRLVLTEFSLLFLATCSPGIRQVTLPATKKQSFRATFRSLSILLRCVRVRVRVRASAANTDVCSTIKHKWIHSRTWL